MSTREKRKRSSTQAPFADAQVSEAPGLAPRTPKQSLKQKLCKLVSPNAHESPEVKELIDVCCAWNTQRGKGRSLPAEWSAHSTLTNVLEAGPSEALGTEQQRICLALVYFKKYHDATRLKNLGKRGVANSLQLLVPRQAPDRVGGLSSRHSATQKRKASTGRSTAVLLRAVEAVLVRCARIVRRGDWPVVHSAICESLTAHKPGQVQALVGTLLRTWLIHKLWPDGEENSSSESVVDAHHTLTAELTTHLLAVVREEAPDTVQSNMDFGMVIELCVLHWFDTDHATHWMEMWYDSCIAYLTGHNVIPSRSGASGTHSDAHSTGHSALGTESASKSFTNDLCWKITCRVLYPLASFVSAAWPVTPPFQRRLSELLQRGDLWSVLAAAGPMGRDYDRHHHKKQPISDNRVTMISSGIIAALSTRMVSPGSLLATFGLEVPTPGAPPVTALVDCVENGRPVSLAEVYRTYFSPIVGDDASRADEAPPPTSTSVCQLQIFFSKAIVVDAVTIILGGHAFKRPILPDDDDAIDRWDDAELAERWPWWDLLMSYTEMDIPPPQDRHDHAEWPVELLIRITAWAQGLSDTTIQALGEDRLHELQRRCLRAVCPLFANGTRTPIPWRGYSSQIVKMQQRGLDLLCRWLLDIDDPAPRVQRFSWWLVSQHPETPRSIIESLVGRKRTATSLEYVLCFLSDALEGGLANDQEQMHDSPTVQGRDHNAPRANPSQPYQNCRARWRQEDMLGALISWIPRLPNTASQHFVCRIMDNLLCCVDTDGNSPLLNLEQAVTMMDLATQVGVICDSNLGCGIDRTFSLVKALLMNGSFNQNGMDTEGASAGVFEEYMRVATSEHSCCHYSPSRFLNELTSIAHIVRDRVSKRQGQTLIKMLETARQRIQEDETTPGAATSEHFTHETPIGQLLQLRPVRQRGPVGSSSGGEARSECGHDDTSSTSDTSLGSDGSTFAGDVGDFGGSSDSDSDHDVEHEPSSCEPAAAPVSCPKSGTAAECAPHTARCFNQSLGCKGHGKKPTRIGLVGGDSSHEIFGEKGVRSGVSSEPARPDAATDSAAEPVEKSPESQVPEDSDEDLCGNGVAAFQQAMVNAVAKVRQTREAFNRQHATHSQLDRDAREAMKIAHTKASEAADAKRELDMARQERQKALAQFKEIRERIQAWNANLDSIAAEQDEQV